MTFVYVIGPADGPLKVGIARDPVWRRGALQVGSHSELIIHAAVPVDLNLAKETERYAHWLLGESSAGGEWFTTTAEDAEKAVSDALIAVTAGEVAPKRPKKVSPRIKRPRMIFELSDEERALLEAHRIRLGLRSHAETLRALIRGGEDGGFDLVRALAERAAPAMTNKIGADGKPERLRLPPTPHVDVPTLARPAFNPQPKTGKAKR